MGPPCGWPHYEGRDQRGDGFHSYPPEELEPYALRGRFASRRRRDYLPFATDLDLGLKADKALPLPGVPVEIVDVVAGRVHRCSPLFGTVLFFYAPFDLKYTETPFQELSA